MIGLIILTVSIILQFTSALFALNLIRLTGRSISWICLATALGLMGVRRTMTLTRVITGGGSIQVDVSAELVALAISLLMLVGIIAIAPLVKRLRQTKDVIALNDLLRESIRQRRQAESRAVKALHRRDQFLAMLSHELRNPLGAILNSAYVLQHAESSDESVARARDVITRQSRQMARLLDELLDASRIAHSKIEIHREDLDLSVIVEEALEVVMPAIEKSRQRLLLNIDDEPICVSGDPTRLQQVVVNLLKNASKYTGDGGTISLTLTYEGREAVLEVEDTGRGIPLDMLECIFDVFVQTDRDIDSSDGGMGLGLTLVRELVRLHGGSVRAFSDGLGKGSRFVVRIPISEHTVAEPLTMDKSTADVSSLRLLLVEDNRDSRDMLQKLLGLQGYDVAVAEDGPAALRELDDQAIDVALIDIGLPGMDGLELARRLRKRDDCRDVLFIALTGYGRPEDRTAANAAGFDHHLVKPLRLELLAELLGTHARNRVSL